MTYQILPIAPHSPTLQELGLMNHWLEQAGKKYQAHLAENERLDKLSITELVDEIFVNWAENELN
jgi:hypothetical protein